MDGRSSMGDSKVCGLLRFVLLRHTYTRMHFGRFCHQSLSNEAFAVQLERGAAMRNTSTIDERRVVS